MTGKGFEVDKGALSSYATTADGLAGQVGEISSGDLAQAQNLPDDLFGDVGREAGFPAALTDTCHTLGSSVTGLQQATQGLGKAVRQALADYEAQDEDHSTAFRSINA
jgi:hypothetical protein